MIRTTTRSALVSYKTLDSDLHHLDSSTDLKRTFSQTTAHTHIKTQCFCFFRISSNYLRYDDSATTSSLFATYTNISISSGTDRERTRWKKSGGGEDGLARDRQTYASRINEKVSCELFTAAFCCMRFLLTFCRNLFLALRSHAHV